MGNMCGGAQPPEVQEQKKKNSEIEKTISSDKRAENKNIKLLLLGAGESGKTTIFKQMKIIHQHGYASDECAKFREVVYSNTLNCARILCIQAEKLGAKLDNDKNQEAADVLIAMNEQQVMLNATSLTNQDVWAGIINLWKDSGIQTTYQRRSEFQLGDSCDYFMENLNRISAPDYKPTQQDVLRCRVKTIGIQENDFELEGFHFKIVDVGGQRNERRKWIHVFDDVTAVLFVISLCEYDQVLFEDHTVNRMKESLMLFDETINCRHFKNTEIIVFFNKKDIFSEKIKIADPGKYFPEYSGGCDYDAALKFIKNLYVNTNKTPKRQIYTHTTCATDTKNVEIVFNAVKNILLHRNLAEANLV